MRTSPKRSFGKLFNAVAVAAALCASTVANAGVLNFETIDNGTFVFAGDVLTIGKYKLEGMGDPGFVANIGNIDTCADGQCPTNNSSIFYQSLNDNYFVLSMANDESFKLGKIDASFIGAGASSYPSTAALLLVDAFDAAGNETYGYLPLQGLVGTSFLFNTFDLTGFSAGKQFTTVFFAAFACDAAGNCDRESNQANFAIDNINTISASDVPEPGSFALMGMGLLGLCAASRRRAAAAI